MAQLWGGRFKKETDQLVYNFNASISFDQKFYEQDISCLLYTSSIFYLQDQFFAIFVSYIVSRSDSGCCKAPLQ